MTAGYYVSFKTKAEILRLRERVEGFESGELYRKITDEYEKKLAEKDRVTADYYAAVRSYTETCHRNGINEIDALQRLSAGKPNTVKEIFKLNSV